MSEPWNLTPAQRRQFRETAAAAKRARMAAPDFPPDIPAADSDDPSKPWRVVDDSGTPVDYPSRREACYAMDHERGSSALYARNMVTGEWSQYETLLREG
jgi:hypothetical protein